MPLRLSVVIPCFNEEACLLYFYERLTSTCALCAEESYELIFVNDGSTDKTLETLKDLHTKDKHVVVIDLSRNHGADLALSAGLALSRGERVLIIDADLQHPPELLSTMMEEIDRGSDVVYGQRNVSNTDSLLKAAGSKFFYRIFSRIAAAPLPHHSGNFRLMTRQVVDLLNSMPENPRFLRGMIAWLGFKQVGVRYEEEARFSGKSKFSFLKVTGLAGEAITSFSMQPLRIVYTVALIFSCIAVFLIGEALYSYMTNKAIRGWTSLMIAQMIFFAVQLLALGIIGEYIGRIFIQVKGRPPFIVKDIYRT